MILFLSVLNIGQSSHRLTNFSQVVQRFPKTAEYGIAAHWLYKVGDGKGDKGGKDAAKPAMRFDLAGFNDQIAACFATLDPVQRIQNCQRASSVRGG